MNRLVAVPLVALLLVTTVTLRASEPLKAVVGSYLDIQDRLFRDSMDGVKPAASKIQQQAAGMGPAGNAIAKAAKALEAAADLKTAREAFGTLSDAVIAAGDAEGWKDLPDIKRAYCPMVNKSWLQKQESVRNPYLGPAMATCGEFKTK